MSGSRTPSQTVGPFFGVALPWTDGPAAAAADAPGVVRIGGRIIDGEGQPVPDALVETWQLGPPGIRGFARSPTDADGRYAIVTVKPPSRSPQAPHLALSVFARGLLKRLVTRLYFADEAAANAGDPVLASIADPAARASLIAAVVDGGGYRFDIRLQGEGETAFFDLHV